MTSAGTFEQLAATMIEVIESAPPVDGPKIVAIGGYPFTGKTQLALSLADRWTRKSFVLATESVIAPRSERLVAGNDGSSIPAHDILALIEYISRLRCHESIALPRYSWHTGSFDGLLESPTLGVGDLVILDGSIATANPVRIHLDASFALRPTPRDAWLRQAIDRDVADRGWSADLACVQNIAKAATVERQLAGYGAGPFQQLLNVRVDGDIWLVIDSQA
jgi:uridine kinase